ncbi:MAG: hypothetical protein ACI9S8_000432 [Chlamydiales bacterium]|jgi:hypothetical protein
MQEVIGLACVYDPKTGTNNSLTSSVECIQSWFSEKGKKIAVLSFQNSGKELYLGLKQNFPERDIFFMNVQVLAQFYRRMNGPEMTQFDHSVDLVILAIPEILIVKAVRFVKDHMPSAPFIAVPHLRGRMPGFIKINVDDTALARPKVAVVFPGAGAGRVGPSFSFLMNFFCNHHQFCFTDTNFNLRMIEKRLQTTVSNAGYSFKGGWLSQKVLDEHYARQLSINPKKYHYSFIHDVVSTHVFSENKEVSFVYLIRDPRDIVNSTYHRMVNDHIVEESEEFLSLDKEDALLAILEGFDYVRKDYVLKWPSLKKMCQDFVRAQEAENIYVLRYEDVRHDPMTAYKALMKWMQLDLFPLCPLNDSIFEEAIYQGTFEAQLGGKRAEGEDCDKIFRYEDGAISSARKGVVGDWKNHFSLKVVQKINEMVSEELVQLGYSLT